MRRRAKNECYPTLKLERFVPTHLFCRVAAWLPVRRKNVCVMFQRVYVMIGPVFQLATRSFLGHLMPPGPLPCETQQWPSNAPNLDFKLCQWRSQTVTTSQRWQCNGCAMLCTTWELWLGSRNEHHLSSQSVNIFEPSASLSWRTSVPSGWSGHIGHHSLSTNSPVACCQGMYNCNMPETLL